MCLLIARKLALPPRSSRASMTQLVMLLRALGIAISIDCKQCGTRDKHLPHTLLRGCFVLARVRGPLAEAARLAAAFAHVVELRAADAAAALHFDLGDARGVDRELSLDALAGDDPADGEHLAGTRAALGD